MDGLVCDLDGVIYRGEEPIPGAAEALGRLRREGARLVLCTNNSTATPKQCVTKLGRMGLRITETELLTSATVTARVMEGRGLRGCRAIVIGGPGLHESMSGIEVRSVTDREDLDVDVAVVGMDRSFDYEVLRHATLALAEGAQFIATNDDATFPAPGGRTWPGAGAIVAALEVASGRSAEVMGKPHAPMMDAAESLLAGARDIAIVGDRPETDLAGGVIKGWRTILVLSGVTSRASAASVLPRPDLIVESVADL